MNETYIICQLATATYKAGGPLNKETLHEALALVQYHFNLDETADPMVLSLAGDIERLLFELDPVSEKGGSWLKNAMVHYRRSNDINGNINAGIHLAYLHAWQAAFGKQKYADRITHWTTTREIWNNVAIQCEKIQKDRSKSAIVATINAWSEEDRRQFGAEGYLILARKAETRYGLDNKAEYTQLEPQLKKEREIYQEEWQSFLGRIDAIQRIKAKLKSRRRWRWLLLLLPFLLIVTSCAIWHYLDSRKMRKLEAANTALLAEATLYRSTDSSLKALHKQYDSLNLKCQTRDSVSTIKYSHLNSLKVLLDTMRKIRYKYTTNDKRIDSVVFNMNEGGLDWTTTARGHSRDFYFDSIPHVFEGRITRFSLYEKGKFIRLSRFFTIKASQSPPRK